MQSTSVSHQQHQSEVMMTPAVTTLLLLTTTTSLASYSPPVKLLPGDSSVTQTGGKIEAQDNQGTGLAPALPLWQPSDHYSQGEFVTQFPHFHHCSKSDPHPIFLSTALIILDRVMYIKSATSPLIHITTSWSIVLLHGPTVAAAEMAKFSMFDCGSTRMSQPLVQQFNLNIPDECSNASTVYHPPRLTKLSRSYKFCHLHPLLSTIASLL